LPKSKTDELKKGSALIRGVFRENPDTMDFETWSIRVNEALWFTNQMSDILGVAVAKAFGGGKKK
jgi:hypothetical protein